MKIRKYKRYRTGRKRGGQRYWIGRKKIIRKKRLPVSKKYDIKRIQKDNMRERKRGLRSDTAPSEFFKAAEKEDKRMIDYHKWLIKEKEKSKKEHPMDKVLREIEEQRKAGKVIKIMEVGTKDFGNKKLLKEAEAENRLVEKIMGLPKGTFRSLGRIKYEETMMKK